MIANFIIKQFVAIFLCPILPGDGCLFTFPDMTLTHLEAAIEGIPSRWDLVADETLTGDERTGPGEGRGTAGVLPTGVGLAGILLAGAGRGKESQPEEGGVEDHHSHYPAGPSRGVGSLLAGNQLRANNNRLESRLVVVVGVVGRFGCPGKCLEFQFLQ